MHMRDALRVGHQEHRHTFRRDQQRTIQKRSRIYLKRSKFDSLNVPFLRYPSIVSSKFDISEIRHNNKKENKNNQEIG